jgi:hypothetical protein
MLCGTALLWHRTWPKMGAGGAQEGLRSLGMYLQQPLSVTQQQAACCTVKNLLLPEVLFPGSLGDAAGVHVIHAGIVFKMQITDTSLV